MLNIKSDQLIFSFKHCKKLECTIKFMTSQIKLISAKKTVITETSLYIILKCQKTSVKAVFLSSVKSVNVTVVTHTWIHTLYIVE